MTVPSDAVPGEDTLTAKCTDNSHEFSVFYANNSFTVTAVVRDHDDDDDNGARTDDDDNRRARHHHSGNDADDRGPARADRTGRRTRRRLAHAHRLSPDWAAHGSART